MRGIRIVALAALWMLCAVVCAPAADTGPEPGRIYRIAYLESGPSWDYDDILRDIQRDLQEMGWGQRVTFPPELHLHLPGKVDDEARTIPLARELMSRDDVDLIISMGTVACRALLKANNGRTPVVGVDLTDPVASGVVRSAENSGVSNFTTAVVPDRWIDMIRLFHEIIPFKRLGIMYINSPTEIVISNVQDAREVGRERGFSVLEDGMLVDGSSQEQCLEALERLKSRGMDAFYIGSLGCFDWSNNDPSPLIRYLNDNHIATFARMGTPLVQLGALMGSSTLDMGPFARFHAEQIVKILSGVRPDELSMVLGRKLGLSINLETARKLGIDLPMEVMVLADTLVVHSSSLRALRNWYAD